MYGRELVRPKDSWVYAPTMTAQVRVMRVTNSAKLEM